MLVRIRMSLPDRPGGLGRVASAIGAAGADVVQVQVISAENGRAVDDVHVGVADTAHLDRLLVELSAVSAVSVEGVTTSPPPLDGHAELQLAAQLVARPERALITLVDGVPAAIGADWAAVLGADAHGALDTVAAAGVKAPDHLDEVADGTLPLRIGTPQIPAPSGRPYAAAATVPLATEPLALLVVRPNGPAFHRSELWRLAELGRMAGLVLSRDPVST